LLSWHRSEIDPWKDIPEVGRMAVVMDELTKYEATLSTPMKLDDVISDYTATT
jgi:hypothetical protein